MCDKTLKLKSDLIINIIIFVFKSMSFNNHAGL